MIRRIIKINSEKCNGCGLCVEACHEGAIGMVDNKAVLLRDDYCDGLGDCLPSCPTGAISFEEREALEYNEAEVKNRMNEREADKLHSGCPGSNAKSLTRNHNAQSSERMQRNEEVPVISQLSQWPVQIKLVPVNAPYFDNAKLLIAADCAAYAYSKFHEKFMKGCVTLIGCPKLDEGDYAEKLTEILSQNSIKNVTVVCMEVPCCGGIENAVIRALENCGKMIPWQVVTLSVNGEIIE